MQHIFTGAEYADKLYVYGFCDGSAAAAVEYVSGSYAQNS
jgi:hypothetical protein